jgi:hypothetical protein
MSGAANIRYLFERRLDSIIVEMAEWQITAERSANGGGGAVGG